MSLYKCKICGKPFERIGNGVYCPGPHYRPCPVCGKPVQFRALSDPIKCCSKECTKILSQQSRKMKICPECGKEFKPKFGGQRYCEGPHKSICVICGNEFEYTCSPKEKPKTCSRKCQEALRSRTAQERYGVSNVSQLSWVQDKISKANGSQEVKEKRRQTCLEKYGVENPMQSNIVKDHMKVSMQQIYGTDYASQNPEVAKKISDKLSDPELLATRRAYYMEKFGHPGPDKTKEFYQKRMIDETKVDEYLAFKEDPKTYIESHYDNKPTVFQLKRDLGVTETPIYDILIAHDCKDAVARPKSHMETSVYEFLCTLIDPSEIIQNDRTLIKPLELDLYLPKYKLAIECNPAATHNSSKWSSGDEAKEIRYHQRKSDLCKIKGVFLFHIFGYEWMLKQDIIKSMLANMLDKNITSIGARKTYVKEINNFEAAKFLDVNHRQGYTSSSIRLGLFTKENDELVSVMTFGRMKGTLGKLENSAEDDYELSRFCSKVNMSVIGGASKLFNHFVETYHPLTVTSFSDVAHTKGTLYEKLGFMQISRTEPNYFYTDLYDTKYINRVNCQKRNIKATLHDDAIDLSKTEAQIMDEHKYVRTYDCGVVKWMWMNNM